MKTLLNISLALLAIVTLTASTALADGYDWRQKITYANSPFNKSTSNSTRTCVARAQCIVQPPVQSQRACSYEPAAPTSFKAGDTIAVTAANASLRNGDRVVATVPRGHRITVSSVKGPWVGTTVEQDGKQIRGWILASDLAGPSVTSHCR